MRKWKTALVGPCAILLLAACAASENQSNTMTRYVLEYDGLEREYFVFLPSSYDGEKEHPVSIFMHGYGGSATGTETEVTHGLNVYAEKFGYVMVYPQSTWFMAGDSPETQWEVTTWNHISDGFDRGPAGPICTADADIFPCPPECGNCGKCGWASCHDDVGFLKSLVETISVEFKIDANDFFVTGFSSGSMMANRIACEASELFAAVALVAGRVEPGFECTPTKTLPILQITGDRDPVVPHDGRVSNTGFFYASTESVSEHWLDDKACSADPIDWTSPILTSVDVQCTIACGETDHPSIDCIWPGGNHRWPGTAGIIGSNGYCVTELQAASMPEQTICIALDRSKELWGSQLVFEFFERHRGN